MGHTSTSATPFMLVPATEHDIDAIAEISGDSFLDDTNTLLKAVWKGDNFHRHGFKEYLHDLIVHPKSNIIVAREGLDGSGKVLGSIIWMKRGYPEDGSAPSTPDMPTTTTTTASFPCPPAPVQPPSPDSPLTVTELEKTSDNAMQHYVSLLMPTETVCRFICGLSVAPAHQGRGIGSALIKWGTDKADEEGVFCWVSSSMGAVPAYAKAGFKEVGKLQLTLDDYAQGRSRQVVGVSGEIVEEPWGDYVWRWMRRDVIRTA
ncbi:hypothetical protein BG004_002132 [Podila humilis]|nr:hypothetical protein BG004_002132 [Podila humilis]